ncbi:MAG: magnesium transporter [Oscillospiraceae bacterium]|nr:magnesium transporter [Oscillospiraceae bacterium]
MSEFKELDTSVNANAPVVFSEEIIALIRSDLTPKKMREQIGDYHEKDIAMALEELSEDECQKLFRLLTMDTLVSVLEYSDDIARFFAPLSMRRKVEALSRMEASTAVELLQQLGKLERDSLTDLLTPELRSEIRLMSSFEEDEIGSRMSTNYIEIPENSTIKGAMSELIRQAPENDNMSVLYVVDEEGTFCGAIDLKDLIIARENTALSDITRVSYPYVYAKALIDDCLSSLIDYSESSIPVLDNEDKLIGVVTAQDFMEVIDEELSEDYAKLAGLTAEEDLSEPIVQSVKKRLPWLGILLALGFVVSAAVGLFESVVAQLPVIMSFQSLILGMAGNVGTQSLAVAIRVLMDQQVDRSHLSSLVWKEARVGVFNGLLLGVLSFVSIGGYLCLQGHAASFAFAISGCLGIAMVLAMVASSLSGTVIPIIFKKLGVDPAVASGPLITTVNDLVAVISYYGLAWIILINWMQVGV